MYEKNIYDCFLENYELNPKKNFLKQYINNKNDFKYYSYEEVYNLALKLILLMKDNDLSINDKVAIIAKNSFEWVVFDIAVNLFGLVSVPILPSATKENIQYIVTHSKCNFIFIGKLDSYDEILSVLNHHTKILSLGSTSCPLKTTLIWDDVLKQPSIKQTMPQISINSTSSIIYTSGTSGEPKGVIVTHGNIYTAAQYITELVKLNCSDRFFSYLPLAHITEKIYILSTAYLNGILISFPANIESFSSNLKDCKPTIFISVPRLWKIFKDKITEKIPSPILKFLLSIPFVNQYIKKLIKSKLGLSSARIMGTGSAPIDKNLLHWYSRLDIFIIEAWGMTESMGLGAINYPYNQHKIGSIGKPIKSFRIKLSETSEILINSKCLFKGYYQNKKFNENIFIDNFFKTGDLGFFDNEGYLYILGRINDAFKTAKGEYIHPARIEKIFLNFCNVDFVSTLGRGLDGPYLVVVASIFSDSDKKKFNKKLQTAIKNTNNALSNHEKIIGVIVETHQWTIDNGFLTPTLKIKRNKVEERYTQYCNLFFENSIIQWID
ncbi:AMP-binding protein [Paraphotobacterium marinum]|uniref:AMP-binding protein n=1 Tax=Paraphotobacterium marinum TaxID=1755811 RepID=UPI0039EADCC3